MNNRKSQFEQLARMIKSKSQQKALEWSASNYANAYQSPLGKGVILITHNEDEGSYGTDPIPVYSLAFINELGVTFHTIDAYLSSDPQYEMLKDIYESAYDSYMRTDDTYNSMMSDILSK
ncbi:MAG: hypothetical protein K2H46_00675 [Muribaculaceae bacterium]|nr:hypothetical protein [Muribaculaceae bacterium]